MSINARFCQLGRAPFVSPRTSPTIMTTMSSSSIDVRLPETQPRLPFGRATDPDGTMTPSRRPGSSDGEAAQAFSPRLRRQAKAFDPLFLAGAR